ncbi:traB domain-containing protein-like [Artemia franciscana]|uniref:traB domain-containing protein-like n=1 Tax=Artemia franciscana TaxID=6661 RepID=UPI0032DB491C
MTESLPDTVTKLVTSDGVPVFLVGTAHFSKESMNDVTRTIQEVKPSIVVVELCKSRSHILMLDEERLLREAENINYQVISHSIKRHGVFKGLVYILFLKVSAQTTKMLGMAPGGEFRVAVHEANQIQSPIFLGDRRIEVTIQRALSACSLWQKLKIFWQLLFFNESLTQEEVEKCKKKDILQELLEEMAGEFPEMTRVFLNERDRYLALSMQSAARSVKNLPVVDPSKTRSVVGVVGIGHVSGIAKVWNDVKFDELSELERIYPPSRASRIIKFSLKFTFAVGAGYLVYRILPLQKVGERIGHLKPHLKYFW